MWWGGLGVVMRDWLATALKLGLAEGTRDGRVPLDPVTPKTAQGGCLGSIDSIGKRMNLSGGQRREWMPGSALRASLA